MLRFSIALISFAVFALAISCGAEIAAGPEEIAERMFEAAQAGDYDRMKSYMSSEMQMEINEAVLAGIEIISFTIDEIEYSDDSTEVELEYTLTLKELDSGDTEVVEDDMEMIRTSEREWVIVEM